MRLEVGEVSGLKGRPRRGYSGVLVRFGKTQWRMLSLIFWGSELGFGSEREIPKDPILGLKSQTMTLEVIIEISQFSMGIHSFVIAFFTNIHMYITCEHVVHDTFIY